MVANKIFETYSNYSFVGSETPSGVLGLQVKTLVGLPHKCEFRRLNVVGFDLFGIDAGPPPVYFMLSS